ncbi:putative ER membrane protein complex subunit 7 [Hypsibius exemplaris]|uniref:ER membrane protein complex subunit 7 n=1 Tax=Hypsibius exemplaris TaxID=2072580 RepID=A0A9X6NFA9_HYPEX|nr:putative ER membrane protein complex subunit 7 [Hypsibius exemplaris]
MIFNIRYPLFIVTCVLFKAAHGSEDEQQQRDSSSPSPRTPFTDSDLFTIEGKLVYVKSQDTKSIDGIRTKISADGEEHFGFLSEDRESFTISGVPPGSYLIEVYHPEFIFETARVDVSSKGKFRARRPDSFDSSAQNQLAYPLRLKLLRKATYFQAKEAWRMTDILMNPMVLMMILPLVVLMGIPKLMSQIDPDASKDMQSAITNQPTDFSSLMSSLLGGGPPAPPPRQAITSKKPERRERKRSG